MGKLLDTWWKVKEQMEAGNSPRRKETKVVCSKCGDYGLVEGYDETKSYLCSKCEAEFKDYNREEK